MLFMNMFMAEAFMHLTIQTIQITIQSQRTQGFCVADFATLSDDRGSRLKFFLLFNRDTEPSIRKFGELTRSKIFGILQTVLSH